MATAALSLIDRLIQLSTVRERNREKYFTTFIEPLFRDGELIAKDYMLLLAELGRRISDADEARDIVAWLEARRVENKALREKVRELLRDGLPERSRIHKNESVALFKKGLWGLMKGAASVVEDGHALTWEYGFEDHTVLDILHHARTAVLDDKARERLIRVTEHQKAAIEGAWRDVAKAYAQLKIAYLA